MPSIHRILEKDHGETLKKLDAFDDVLKRLRYEGKASLGRNVRDANELVGYFERTLLGHMKEEERVLFPFMRKRIPRLEPLICLLLSEHDDLRQKLRRLRSTLKSCGRASTPRAVGLLDAVCHDGTFLICLLHSHMSVETGTLYKAADRTLRPFEKEMLLRRIGEYAVS
ncbi:MAG: hypothetical protein A3D28_06070 [Omnitrophica bacterium RIFCSPHIGHO2_02_FULL_63_14]|nr:MAG: hypothetical protein A3D28_06070 [Omnitrophica bacterium RIFCSPHIGHO2_02_FULL_63_14]